ncbi:hypothetical protein QBC34DRAFT_416019 [Podospora aff. communis PSN243]|uniref:Nephrocystin 3-like N-terminal domain-containing protein n=1 Tax=Podospora aff. communis PSN243 TaxID=3040156 RepID=A0AAV9G620_9PEZI|nr:hypothetical protein QBC34DRAFT_416019 [Podospora aff. communis PSN243]
MWIRDALPLSIPGMRTLIYGYDSLLVHSSSFQSISDIAKTLALELKGNGWTLPSSKPIILLAHSLGGLVLKEAIVQMADRDKSFSGILNNISGAVMFGVPSLGMQQCHLMAMVEGQPNEFLIEDLSRQTGVYLRDLSAKFDGLSFLQRAKVFWAYETRESPTVERQDDNTWARTGPPAVLVSPDSATCNRHRKNKAETFPINEDHSKMVKFSRGDQNLLVVTQLIRGELDYTPERFSRSSTLMDLETRPRPSIHGRSGPTASISAQAQAADLTEVNKQPEETKTLQEPESPERLEELGKLLHSTEDALRQLQSSELDLRFQQIEDPFQDTFEWAFHLPILTDWLQQRFNSKVFWIYGKPGSGKSTFMKFLFQSDKTWELLHDWKSEGREIRAGFFFHYRGSAIQKSFEGVLRSLIAQVLSPHSASYRERHNETWELYQRAKRQCQNLKSRIATEHETMKSTAKRINDIKKEIETEQDKMKQLMDDQLRANLEDNGEDDHDDFDEDPIQKDLKKTRHTLESLHNELKTQRKRHASCKTELPELDEQLRSKMREIQYLDQRCLDEDDIPTRTFLAQVVTEFEKRDSRLIPKLEKIVRRILNQEALEMDIILFFDALDEFDGHPDVISQFMKDLAQGSPQSKTRVKICLSSRPWKALQDHFSAYPQLALEMHTKYDIEDYVTRSVRRWSSTESFAHRLISTILTRANGVFLWVRLAVRVLSEALTVDGRPATLEQLEARLRELPEDLFEFYRLIVERIGRLNRRRTFALLELLARHNPDGPQLTAAEAREAVLVSDCTDFQDAEEVIAAARACDKADRARIDLATWGGGLVEIKRDRPQLMHQTVLEFVMGLDFKKVVLGDHLADFVSENGHLFHVRYWASRKNWENLSWSFVRRHLSVKTYGSKHLYFDVDKGIHGFGEFQHLAYHSERAEATTGRSQFDFFDSLSILQQKAASVDSWAKTFLFAIVSCGLTLGTRDWIAKNPGDLERLTHGSSENDEAEFPLFSSTFFAPILPGFHTGYLKIFPLLLDNGFQIGADRYFFPLVCAALWDSEFRKGSRVIDQSTLLEAATLALQHGQDANAEVHLEIFDGRNDNLGAKFVKAGGLHVCLPALAERIIQHGGNPNKVDELGLTALDWVLEFPSYMRRRGTWDCKRRYDMCTILVQAGAAISYRSRKKALRHSLAEFEAEGYDTRLLYDTLVVEGEGGTSDWKLPTVGGKRKRRRKRVDSSDSELPVSSDEY